MSLLEVVKVGLLVFIAVGLVAVVPVMFWLTRRIIGEVRAAGLVRAALDDEFGPPPGVVAGVQAGRHRGLYVVGSRRPVLHRVMGAVYRLAAG